MFVTEATKKRIICLETGMVFDCAKDVSDKYNIAEKTVLNYIREKKKLKRLNLQFAFLAGIA